MADQAVPGVAVIVALPADIDYGNGDQAYEQLYAAFAAGAPVVVADFTATTFCDCAALRRLLAVQRHADALGAQLRLAVPLGGQVLRVLEITSLDRLFQVYPSACHAAAGLQIPPPRPPLRRRPWTITVPRTGSAPGQYRAPPPP